MKRWLPPPLLLATMMTAVAVIQPIVTIGARTEIAPNRRDSAKQAALNQKSRVTQAEREAAAARLELQQSLLANTDAIGAAALASIVPSQGGIPDYFGSPNWAYSPPLRKFMDTLPGLTPAGANNLGQFLAVAHPDTTTYPGSDYYEIELRQYTEQMHSDLPPTTLRGYVQTNLGTDVDGNNTIAPDPGPHQMGPFIIATKDRPVRVKFTNKLPTGTDGDLFLPVDTTIMGAGMGPLGMDAMPMNYTQNRATLHLHGGVSPWISDGTPHQWITPAGEDTPYPKGVSVVNVPDMPDPGDGSQTFFYTNQQSARLMFYHDHSYGITRLNVYAGEAAGYLLNDPTSDKLVADGLVPEEQIPLIIQDKTFVDTSTVLTTDPTWNWGSGTPDADGIRTPVQGDLWYPHVYSPAQNPADIAGMNAFGRWHYGPWFWPPTTNITNPPIPNPYYDPVNAPWEPALMPATPNPSAPGEAFLDTPIVNGTAFPKMDVQPKAYRFRILNAADDRFFNLQLYVADPTTMSVDGRVNTEVTMVPASAVSTWPATWPTDGREGGVPDYSTAGPEWVQIATESGLLPKPAIIPQQPVTWNLDPTTFGFGNVQDHSLLLGTAERADVIVDFSAYAGKTLILYNDAPTAFPALDPRTDFYTNDPDRTDTGGHWGTKVGYGPNTRTIMQINVANTTPAPTFDIAALNAAFASTDTTPGAFAASQNPILIPDARYDEAYAGTFPVDTYARIFEFSKAFTTINGNTVNIDFKNKALQDEMGEAFDPDYGRMMVRFGLELPTAQVGAQRFILQGYIDPPTEQVKVEMEPLAPVQGDGTQMWKITHNGVDTHTIHFHLFDVQLLNRVGWDNAIYAPDDNELGWKDTLRVNPLQDTVVVLRPVLPKVPFGVPDSIRPYDPTMPLGSTAGFANRNPLNGDPMTVTNQLHNFGWEYVWHCHILAHEEMDMMRPVEAIVPRSLPTLPIVTYTVNGGQNLTWTDGTPVDALSTWGNPANEIGFRIERATIGNNGKVGPYQIVGSTLANDVTFTDPTALPANGLSYRVVAFNAAGDSPSSPILIRPATAPPAPPTVLSAILESGPQVVLSWTDNAGDEDGFVVERSTNGGAFLPYATLPAHKNTGAYGHTDTTVLPDTTYAYRVYAVNGAGASALSNTAEIIVPPLPAAPSNLGATAEAVNNKARVTLTWTDGSTNETGFEIQRALDANFTTGLNVTVIPVDTTTAVQSGLSRATTYWYRVRAINLAGASEWSNSVSIMTP